MMGASGKGRAGRGAQAERAAPDLAEADLTARSADRLARRQHVKGEAGGLLQARGEESSEDMISPKRARKGLPNAFLGAQLAVGTGTSASCTSSSLFSSKALDLSLICPPEALTAT